MEILRVILTILLVIDCIALTAVVLLQEGKQTGLGTLGGGATDTFWEQNKGRSAEGLKVKLTKVLAIMFIVLTAALNLGVFT